MLYLVIPLNFSLPPGSLSFSFIALLLHLKLAVWLYAIARRQQQEGPGRLTARSLWLNLAQAGEEEEGIEDDEDDGEHSDSDSSPVISKEEEAAMQAEWTMDKIPGEDYGGGVRARSAASRI